MSAAPGLASRAPPARCGRAAARSRSPQLAMRASIGRPGSPAGSRSGEGLRRPTMPAWLGSEEEVAGDGRDRRRRGARDDGCRDRAGVPRGGPSRRRGRGPRGCAGARQRARSRPGSPSGSRRARSTRRPPTRRAGASAPAATSRAARGGGPRDRGHRRGAGPQGGAVRGAPRALPAGGDPRHQHLRAVGDRHRVGERPPGARRRPALLQPGAADAAGRGRAHGGGGRGRVRRRAGVRAGPRQGGRAVPRHAGLPRQPAADPAAQRRGADAGRDGRGAGGRRPRAEGRRRLADGARSRSWT